MERRTPVVIAREGRFQLHMSLAHIHGVGREAGSNDDGFGNVDVERVVIEVGEREPNVEGVSAVCQDLMRIG